MNTLNRLSAPLYAGLALLAFALLVPAAAAQMPEPDTTQLSSSDVSDEQVEQAANIAIDLQMSGREMRMEMQKEMREKYGNPQEMDSTEKAAMQKERQQQMQQMQKEQIQMMEEKAEEEGMDTEMFQRIMQSARQDSTLQERLRTAMKSKMEEEGQQMQGGQQGGGGPGQ
ncbi:MAG: DUF4168 domain-containing protein [Salinibacter sp.]